MSFTFLICQGLRETWFFFFSFTLLIFLEFSRACHMRDCFSKCDPWTSSISIIWDLGRNEDSEPYPWPTELEMGWHLSICIWRNPPGDLNVQSCLRTTGGDRRCGPHFVLRNYPFAQWFVKLSFSITYFYFWNIYSVPLTSNILF